MALLSGKPVAEKILRHVRARILEKNLTPGLGVILVGDDPASHLYVSFKEKAAQEVGIHLEKRLFSASAQAEEIFAYIDTLNERPDIHGILIQLPLPQGLPTDALVERIGPEKDVDGFQRETVEKFLAGDITACPVFPRAVFELLLSTGKVFQGERGLVLANSDLLGRMMTRVLSSFGIEGEYILSRESEDRRRAKLEKAHVIVSACGVPRLITGDMVRAGAVIIDGGIAEEEGKVVGDVERSSVENKAAYLTPVPGGVGPVTVACLLARLTETALARSRGTMGKL